MENALRCLSPTHQWLALLALLLLIGVGVRLTGVEQRSLWQDEVFTASLATGNRLFEATILPDTFEPDAPVAQSPAVYRQRAIAWQPWPAFVTGLAHNVQMPLYPVLMRGWMAIMGPDPVLARSVSVLFGVLCLPAMAWFAWLAGGRRLALVATTILTLSGFQVIYSQTARLYPLLALLALLGAALALCLIRRYRPCLSPARSGPVWPLWAGWALVSVAGLYTHYFYVLALAAHGLWLLVALWGDRRALRAWAVVMVLMGLSLLAWLPMWQAQQAFLAHIGHGSLSGLWKPLTLCERLWKIAAEMLSPKSLWIQLTMTLIFLAAAVRGLWSWLGAQRQEAARRANLPFWLGLSASWLVCVVGGLVLVDILSQTHRIFSSRYLMLASPALYLALAGALLALPRRLALGLGLTLGLLMAHNLGAVLDGSKFLKKEDYRRAGRLIAQQHHPGDLVLACHSAVHAAGLAFYLPDTLAMAGLSRRNPGVHWTPAALDARLSALATGRDRVWLALSHCRPALAVAIQQRLTAQGFRPCEPARFSSMQVLHFVRARSRRASGCPRPETPHTGPL